MKNTYINVFLLNAIFHICSKYYKYKTYYYVLQYLYTITNKEFNITQINELIRQIIPTNKQTEWDDEWYIKHNIKHNITYSTQPCANGRLIQRSSTCWLNVVLNTLILPEITRELLIKKSNEKFGTNNKCVENDLTYDLLLKSCPISSVAINERVLLIVYMIFCNKKKLNALEDNINIMRNLAVGIQKHDAPKNKNTYMIIKQLVLEIIGSVSYYISKAIIKILVSLFTSDECKIIELLSTHLNYDTSKQTYSVSGLIEKHIHDLIINEQPNIICYNVDKYCNYITNNDDIPKSIKNYKLVSCCIKLNNHVITGFICNDIYYVYDSNMQSYPIMFDWTDPTNQKSITFA